MTYSERIDICKKLLSDVRDVISDDEGKEELSRVLAGLSEYVEGQAFLENTDEEKALEEGDETVASMNINEWMDVNGDVIVDNGDERLEPSSGGDDESVNSRTRF